MASLKLSASSANRWLDRRGSMLLGILGIIVTAVVAVVAIDVYTTNTGQDEAINTQSTRLTKSLCAQADVVALAFRERVPRESREHFIARMLSQRQVLRYSFGLGCSSIKGFEQLPQLRRAALDEIATVLEMYRAETEGPQNIKEALERAIDETQPDASVNPSTSPGVAPGPVRPSTPSVPPSGGTAPAPVDPGNGGSGGGSGDSSSGGSGGGGSGGGGSGGGGSGSGSGALLPGLPGGGIQVPGLECHVTAAGIKVCG